MNRIQEYYDTACVFMALPDMARYVIGTTIHGASYPHFVANEDTVTKEIFIKAVQKGKFKDFKIAVEMAWSRANAKRDV